jgi:Fe-S cluster assembly scaffold protein SufB
MTKQDTIDLNLLIATFRCFNEQLYNLKGSHAGIVKMKFNRLLKVSSQYEKEIVKWTDGSEELEQVYDELMDIIIEVKRQSNER